MTGRLPGVERDQASRTAVLVCQGRAVAHGRLADGRFNDPMALQVLRDDERTPVVRARSDPPPKGWAARLDFELLGRQAEVMAVRTVAVDDAVRAAANPQLVIVGAGLDARAWRMPELAEVNVFEVDHLASQSEKRARTAGLGPPVASLHFVPADLNQTDLDTALDAAGHQASRPTTWVLEGVVPYLTEEAAVGTVTAIAARSAPGSTLVMTYHTSSPRERISRLLARAMFLLMGRGDPAATEPRRSSWAPESIQGLIVNSGLALNRDIRLAELALELLVPDRRVRASHVAVAVSPDRR